jgi:hypothetical protein
LRSDQLQQILDIELRTIQERVCQTAHIRFHFKVTDPARRFLLLQGTNSMYGARHLKRTIERHVVCPLARLVTTNQIQTDDMISIDWEGSGSELRFAKERGSELPSLRSLPNLPTGSPPVSPEGNRFSISAPSTSTGGARMKESRAQSCVDTQSTGRTPQFCGIWQAR